MATPTLALARLSPVQGRTLFFTPAAAGFLKPFWREMQAAKPGKGSALLATPEATAREWDAAAHNPKAWRALDRSLRFSTLLLTGDPAGFRPLLDHLRKSPDWTLTWLDHTSLIFDRSPARAWVEKDLAALKATFASHPRMEQLALRVQVAHRLTAIGELDAAKRILEEALRLDGKSAPAWTELACIRAASGRWDETLSFSNRALDVDRHYLPATAAKANALYAFGKFSDALALTRKLVEATPNDGQTLELHARVAHAAHAFREEIPTLEKIVAMSKAKAMATGGWRVYLGQAYAADSQPDAALAQFEEALKEPDLPESERTFAQKGIERIRSRTAVF